MSNINYLENDHFEEKDLRYNDIKKPSIIQACILYSISVMLFLFVAPRVQRNEFYSGILITEFILVLLPPLALLLIYRYDIRKVLRLNKVSFINIFLTFWMMLFALPLVAIANLINLSVIKYFFGKIVVEQPPVATDWKSLLINVLVIGGAAGICEEVLFRGVIQRGFEKFGTRKAILLAAFLFGLMHVDFQKLLGTFLLGALMGFIVYRTNSLFTGMFAHFTNNSIAVVLAYALNKLAGFMESSGLGGANSQSAGDLDLSVFASMPSAQLIAVIIVWTFIFLFCAIIFTGLLIAFMKTTSNNVVRAPKETDTALAKGLLWLLPGVLIVGFIYFAQGLTMLNKSMWVVDNILRIIGLK